MNLAGPVWGETGQALPKRNEFCDNGLGTNPA